MENIIIRPYQDSDRQALRQIAYDTALLGDSAKAFFDDSEILEDYLTSYFLDYEPHSCFIAEAEKRVIGYLMGSKDKAKLEQVFQEKILLPLLIKSIKRNIIFKKTIASFIFNSLVSFLKGELITPDFSRDYPATLHVNIEEPYRRQGIGAKLMNTYLEYLAKEGVKGVHFATLSDKAAKFYQRLGFLLLHISKRSYLRNVLQRELTCYIFGKKLKT